jgi:hypothetical protein
MKMEQTEYSETSVYKIQTPGNYPEEGIQQQVMGSCNRSNEPSGCIKCELFIG